MSRTAERGVFRTLVLALVRPAVLAVLREERSRTERHAEVFGPEGRLHVPAGLDLHSATINTVSGHVAIGRDSFVGHHVMLLTGTHDLHARGADRVRSYPTEGRDIVIGEGVWIASGAIILGPCRIGDHAAVAAGAVVTSNVPPGSVVAGVPARVVAQADGT